MAYNTDAIKAAMAKIEEIKAAAQEAAKAAAEFNANKAKRGQAAATAIAKAPEKGITAAKAPSIFGGGIQEEYPEAAELHNSLKLNEIMKERIPSLTDVSASPASNLIQHSRIDPNDVSAYSPASARLRLASHNGTSATAPIATKKEPSKDFNIWDFLKDKAGVGIAETAEGFVNELSYKGQLLAKQREQQAAESQAAFSALIGNKEQAKTSLERSAELGKELYGHNKNLDTLAGFGDDKAAEVEEKYADADIGNGLRFAGDLAQAGGQLLVSIAGSLINPALGLGISAMSAAGNATQEAKNSGASDSEAMAYGTAVGAIEAVTEKIVGGVGGVFGKGFTDEGVKAAIKANVKNVGAQKLLTALTSAVTEGGEEFLSELGGHLANKLIVGTDTRGLSEAAKDGLYSALIGSVIGGIVDAGGGLYRGKRADTGSLAAEVAQNIQSRFQKRTANKPQNSPSGGVSSEATNNAAESGNAERNRPGIPGFETGAVYAKESTPTMVTDAETPATRTPEATVPVLSNGSISQDSGNSNSQSVVAAAEAARNYKDAAMEALRNGDITKYARIISGVESVESSAAAAETARAEQQESPGMERDGGIFGRSVGAAQYAEGKQVDTENKAITRNVDLPEELRAKFSPGTHERITNDMSIARAGQSIMVDIEGNMVNYEDVLADLREIDQWDSINADTAMLMAKEAYKRDDMETLEYLMQRYAETETGAARILQASQKWVATPEGAAAEASKLLKDAAPGVDKKDIIKKTYTEAERITEAKGNVSGLVESIRRTARKRHTQYTKSVDQMLRRQGAKDVEWLERVAWESLHGVAADFSRPSTDVQKLNKLSRRAKNYVITNQLFRVTTTVSNFMSNIASFASETVAGDMPTAALADYAMSKFTGVRTHSFEVGPFAKQSREMGKNLAEKSWCEIWLDANASNVLDKYTGQGVREHKMAGGKLLNGKVAQFQSTIDAVLGVALNTTDRLTTGWQEGSVLAALQKKVERGELTQEQANQIAEIRGTDTTFHNKTAIGRAATGAQKALNLGFEYGAGNIIAGNYLNVPAAILGRMQSYKPSGFIPAILDVAKVCYEAKKGVKPGENISDFLKGEETTIEQRQARATQEIGRATVGSAALVGFTALALKGAIRRFDDDDADKAAYEAAEGRTGIVINWSSLLRGARTGDWRWQDGDVMTSLTKTEPLTANIHMAVEIADAIKDDGVLTVGEIAKADLNSLERSVAEMSLLENIGDIYTALQYKDSDESALKAVGREIAANNITSLVPGLIQQTAKATDPYYRELYSKEDTVGQLLDTLAYAIPGARQKLPVKQTGTGEPKQYTDNPALRAINALLNPFTTEEYRQEDITPILESVYSATGNAAIYPSRKAPDSFSASNVTYSLTPDEKRVYQEIYGDEWAALADSIIGSEVFNMLPAEAQANALEGIHSSAQLAAKAEILARRGVDALTDSEKAKAALDEGDMVTYLVYSNAYNSSVNTGGKDTTLDMLKQNGGEISASVLDIMAEVDGYKKLQEANDRGVSTQTYFYLKGAVKEAGVPDGYSNTPPWYAAEVVMDADATEGEKLGYIKGLLSGSVPDKFQEAYDSGIPLEIIVTYYSVRCAENDEGNKLSKAQRKEEAAARGVAPYFDALESIWK